jgi:hypothetical protein
MVQSNVRNNFLRNRSPAAEAERAEHTDKTVISLTHLVSHLRTGKQDKYNSTAGTVQLELNPSFSMCTSAGMPFQLFRQSATNIGTRPEMR